jgi:ribosomal protein L16 Arg81 hydroxylase
MKKVINLLIYRIKGLFLLQIILIYLNCYKIFSITFFFIKNIYIINEYTYCIKYFCRFFSKIISQSKKMNYKNVERVKKLKFTKFLMYYYEKRPIIIEGITSQENYKWATNITEFQKQLLKMNFIKTNKIVEYLTTSSKDINYVSQHFSIEKKNDISILFEKIVHNKEELLQLRLEPIYLLEQEKIPKFLNNFQISDEDSVIFITSNNLRTSLHSDTKNNLLIHLFGQKRFVIMDPKYTDSNKEKLSEIMKYRQKSGNIDELYLNNSFFDFPFYYDVLNPNDLLYIPKRWLHDIQSFNGGTVSIAARFQDF